MSKFAIMVVAASVAAFFGSGGYVVVPAPLRSSARALFDRTCTIKGNISIATGEKIYHLPGQDYYESTVISPRYGERWFCSEEEARAAGWRRARR